MLFYILLIYSITNKIDKNWIIKAWLNVFENFAKCHKSGAVLFVSYGIGSPDPDYEDLLRINQALTCSCLKSTEDEVTQSHAAHAYSPNDRPIDRSIDLTSHVIRIQAIRWPSRPRCWISARRNWWITEMQHKPEGMRVLCILKPIGFNAQNDWWLFILLKFAQRRMTYGFLPEDKNVHKYNTFQISAEYSTYTFRPSAMYHSIT